MPAGIAQLHIDSDHGSTACDAAKPPLVALDAMALSSTLWLPPLCTLTASHLRDGPATAERFRQQLPHARVELVDDANHLEFIDQPEVVTEHPKKYLGTT